MSNRVIKVFGTIICSLIAFFVYAEEFETQISADKITAEPGGILIAEGNVLVQYGSNKIEAKEQTINSN